MKTFMYKTVSVLAFIILFLNVGKLEAQGYEPLECKGKIPNDFTTLSKVKSQLEIEAEKRNYKDDYKTRQNKSTFISVSNFLLDQILLSGRVLFNDSITNYLNSIADIVLAKDSELRGKIKVYVIRSTVVNAFTTNNGMIFFTTGLISEVENEAQLAFILAHEITHFEKRHVINTFLEKEKLSSKNDGLWRYSSYDDDIKKMSQYSKNLELQSDSNAVFRIAATNYSVSECLKSMDVLQFSDLPFDEVRFDESIIEKGHYDISGIYLMDTVKKIDIKRFEDVDDSKATHPNIKLRRESLNVNYQAAKNLVDGEKFIIGEKVFSNIQHLARMETIRLLLNERSYAEVIYEASVLLKDGRDTRYLNKAIAKSMYGIAKYKSASQYQKTVSYFSKYEGEIQRCIFLFESLSKDQMNLMAARYLYDFCLENPDLTFYQKLRDDIFQDLIYLHEYDFEKLQSLSKEYAESIQNINRIKNDTIVNDTLKNDEVNSGSSKYEKFRLQKELEKVEKVNTETNEIKLREFSHIIFDDLLNDSEFNSYMSKMKEAADYNKQAIFYGQDNSSTRKNGDKKKEGKDDLSIGLDTVMIVDPFYVHLDVRKSMSILDSEEKLVNFSQDINDMTRLAGIEPVTIAPKLFTDDNIEKYNDLAALNFWMSERLAHENIRMIPLESEYMDPVIKANGTDKMIYSGIFSYREKKENVGLALLGSLVIYIAPFTIAYLVKPNMHTYYYTLLFDLNSGSCYVNETKHFNMNGKRGLIRSNVYDLMLHLKQNPK